MTNSMNTNFDYLIISPHPDDAVASLGQHILNWQREGKTVKVITVFNEYGTEELSSENAWDYLLKSGFKNVKEFATARHLDDRRVMTELGVEFEYLNYVDAAFRRFSNTTVYLTAQALMSGRPSTFDSGLPAKIYADLSGIEAKTTLFPYGVGGHVDHAILRKVGDKLKKDNQNVMFYLESPYLWRHLNYLKYSVHILRAKSYINQIDNKMKLLKDYPSQYQMLVHPHEKFPEVVVDR
ncbi:PIG-L family deacetylase [Candidatus Shapirobacteria bacterium]|nr:PIG-L family deacetylase [Candidatus Shapirobacteria bacterium]